jgi:CBS domain-containing protein
MATGAFFEIQTVQGPLHVVDPRSPLSVLATREAVAVPESCSLAEAVEVMQGAEVSAVVVGDRAGIVTERDFARALGAGFAGTAAVETIATRHPLTVPGDTTVIAAAGLMLNEHVRHLLVELENGTTGVVSIRDVLAALLQAVDPHLWLTSLRVAIESPSEMWLG